MTTTLTADESAIGKALTAITLGIDAFQRKSATGGGLLDGEGLVPIYIGHDLVAGETFADWHEAFAALEALERDVARLPASAHATFLRQMVRSVATAAKLFSGANVDFREKLESLVGVPPEPVPQEQIDAIHATLDRLLSALGFVRGTLAERLRAWESERFLDPDAIPGIFEEMMRVAQARTDERIFPTGDYTMRLNPMRGVPYTARCNFNNGAMDINLDVRFTRPALKHLVCHEVFPGHSTQLLSTLDAVKRGTSSADALLCTVNGATGAVQEGIGDQGIDLIDWVEDDDDALHIELRRLQTATGTNAAWHYNVDGWSREATQAYLQDVGFGQEAWARGRTAMASHPFRGGFVSSYWYGNETVKALREAAGTAGFKPFVTTLYAHCHSVASLREAVAAA